MPSKSGSGTTEIIDGRRTWVSINSPQSPKPEQTTPQIGPEGDKGARPAQRTYGTTDPGGVWHPVHRRECLTILLGTYVENGQCNPTDDERIVFGTACLCLHWQPPILSISGLVRLLLKERLHSSTALIRGAIRH